jgi:two-component system sensor histidine kinase AgrC
MNDLYVELQAIPNESLRAFIYYKLMQGIESHVDMRLHTSMDGTYSQTLYNLPDFIRILGVFIDNSIEEAVQTDDKLVLIRILEQDEKISITVKNSIRSIVKNKGILPGTTTKGLGRGNGLAIAKQIIEKYDNILWNSYFQDNLFVKMISFTKE